MLNTDKIHIFEPNYWAIIKYQRYKYFFGNTMTVINSKLWFIVREAKILRDEAQSFFQRKNPHSVNKMENIPLAIFFKSKQVIRRFMHRHGDILSLI